MNADTRAQKNEGHATDTGRVLVFAFVVRGPLWAAREPLSRCGVSSQSTESRAHHQLKSWGVGPPLTALIEILSRDPTPEFHRLISLHSGEIMQRTSLRAREVPGGHVLPYMGPPRVLPAPTRVATGWYCNLSRGVAETDLLVRPRRSLP